MSIVIINEILISRDSSVTTSISKDQIRATDHAKQGRCGYGECKLPMVVFLSYRRLDRGLLGSDICTVMSNELNCHDDHQLVGINLQCYQSMMAKKFRRQIRRASSVHMHSTSCTSWTPDLRSIAAGFLFLVI